MDIEEGEHTSAGSLRTRGQERGRGTTTGRPRDRQDEKGRKIKGKVNENSRKQTPGRGRKEVRKRLDGPWHATEPKPRNQKRPRVDENGQRMRKVARGRRRGVGWEDHSAAHSARARRTSNCAHDNDRDQRRRKQSLGAGKRMRKRGLHRCVEITDDSASIDVLTGV